MLSSKVDETFAAETLSREKNFTGFTYRPKNKHAIRKKIITS